MEARGSVLRESHGATYTLIAIGKVAIVARCLRLSVAEAAKVDVRILGMNAQY